MLQIEFFNFIASIIASALSLLLGVFAWRQRRSQGTVWFSGLLLAFTWVGWWAAFEALSNADINTYVTFSKLEYVGEVFIPYLWLRLAMNTGDRGYRFSRTLQASLMVVPFTTLLLVMTNEYHGQIWLNPQFVFIADSPVFEPVYGAWFWIHVVYCYSVFLIGSIILIRYAISAWRVYRLQALMVLIGTAIPWIGNIFMIFDSLNPVPYLYLNSVLGGICAVCLSFGLLRLRLLDITPLAYETILNNIPAGILVVDLRNRILAVNDTFKEMFHLENVDVIGQAFEVALPYCADQMAEVLKSVDGKGRFNKFDHIYEVTSSIAYGRDGAQRGRLFAISDVTASVQVEIERQSEREFSDMIGQLGSTLNSSLDVSRISSFIIDILHTLVPHGRLNLMLIDNDGTSTSIVQHRGYTSEEIDVLSDLVFDYRISPVFDEAIRPQTHHSIPNIRTDQDWKPPYGLESDTSFAIVSIITENNPIGFINIDCDRVNVFTPELTNRLQIFGQQAALAIKNAQLYEQTRRQADELRSRVTSMTITQQVYKDIGFSIDGDSLPQLILDASLRISRADAGYFALLKDNQLQLQGLFGDYDIERLHDILVKQSGIIPQSIANRNPLVIQTPNPIESAHADIQAQIALPLFTAQPGENAHLQGIIVLETKNPARFTEDRLQLLDLISDRAAVALQNVELVNRVRERADELELLYGKVSYLEKFKTDMIRVAAHDLKNPLGVIRNYLTMLIDSPELELDLDKVYPSMLRSAERMLQIVQNFLSMDRIERAAKLQTMEPFDLGKVVENAVAEYLPRADQKGQWMDVLLPPVPCMVRGDAAQIYEAVSNFISNAIKYTPANGHISVMLEAYENTAQLEVTDNGFGIPEENQSKLFKPFYRSQTSETADIEGTGLGLHLTKSIIEQQDGEVIFNSVYQHGSTFGFKMPLYQAEKTKSPVSNLIAS